MHLDQRNCLPLRELQELHTHIYIILINFDKIHSLTIWWFQYKWFRDRWEIDECGQTGSLPFVAVGLEQVWTAENHLITSSHTHWHLMTFDRFQLTFHIDLSRWRLGSVYPQRSGHDGHHFATSQDGSQHESEEGQEVRCRKRLAPELGLVHHVGSSVGWVKYSGILSILRLPWFKYFSQECWHTSRFCAPVSCKPVARHQHLIVNNSEPCPLQASPRLYPQGWADVESDDEEEHFPSFSDEKSFVAQPLGQSFCHDGTCSNCFG